MKKYTVTLKVVSHQTIEFELPTDYLDATLIDVIAAIDEGRVISDEQWSTRLDLDSVEEVA